MLLRYKGKRAWATEMAVVVLQQDEEKFLKSCFLASSACSLLMFTPRSPAQPCQRFRGFSFQQEAIQNVIKCHRKQGGREKIADIKQDAHWHHALLHQPEVSVLWSCFYCDPSKFMYALCIFRSLYTFDILFLFFELWSQRVILIVKSSQWGGWVRVHTHTHRASQIAAVPYQHPCKHTALTKSTACLILFLVSSWLGLKSTSGKYVCVCLYILCIYVHI